MKIYIFGGMNIDISGKASIKLVEHDSNPGKITFSYGGVARNVAINLANLGLDVTFFSVTGDDYFSKALLADCIKHHINVDNCLIIKGESPSTYLSLENVNGEMEVGINSMDILYKVHEEHVKPMLDMIKEDDLVFVDTNYSEEVINYILDNCKGKIFVDPISIYKSDKIKRLDRIYCFKPNRIEAEHLSNKHTIEEMQQYFLDKGVKNVVISDGPNGVYGCRKDEKQHYKSLVDKVANVTGAGDAMMAGLIYSTTQNLNLIDSLKVASVTAKLAAECETTINENVNITLVNELLKEL